MRGPERAAEETPPEDHREIMRTISHNLRTPLAVIKGCTDMLLAHGPDELGEERRRELLVTASANVDRLADAIVWLEERIDALTKSQTIRLPDEATAARPDETPHGDPDA